MRILQDENPDDRAILETKSKPVKESELSEVLELSRAFADICRTDRGVWFAAIQAGVQKRFFVSLATWLPEVFINPKIIRGEWMVQSSEGCLSRKWKWNKIVRRYARIIVRYRDENFVEYERILSKLPAIVFQHELDHLNGIVV